jgi:2-methylcitrate dehydratase PrpD
MGFDRIADFVLQDRETPENALSTAALLLVDTLGVAAGAAGLDAGRIARDHAVAFHGAGAPENAATLLFDGRRASIPGAAFAAATQIDNLDAHDGYNPTKGHIGCAVVPALFAFSEAKPDLTAREALAAMVMAYEVAARAAVALHATVSDYHTSGAWNALAVAALGCRLLGSGRDVLRQALGIAEYHGPRSQMMREIANPTMLHDGSGMGALVGAMAALMARTGFTGAPAITVEAEEAAPFWADLGQVWTIERNYIKPYPICRWAHAALDALDRLKRRHGFGADDVARIEVRTFTHSAQLAGGMPESTGMAQYSLPFPMAVMLVHGRIGPEHIDGPGLVDSEVAAVVPRIHVTEEYRHSARFPAGRWSDISVFLRDGTRLDSGDTEARGGPEAPMALEEVEAKFHIMSGVLPETRRQALWAMRERLVQPETRFADLARLAFPDAGTSTA